MGVQLLPSKRTVSILSTVAAIVDEYKFLSNWLDAEFQGWTHPAIAEPHCGCGLYVTKGCLKNELHKKLGKGNLIYIKQYQNSCYRAVCKICYLKWIVRQANSATQKIEYYSKKTGKKPIHLILIANLKQQDLPVKLAPSATAMPATNIVSTRSFTMSGTAARRRP